MYFSNLLVTCLRTCIGHLVARRPYSPIEKGQTAVHSGQTTTSEAKEHTGL